MITNQRQYHLTSAAAERYRKALTTPVSPELHPKAAKAIRDGLQSQLADLEAELADFDKVRHETETAFGKMENEFESDSILGIGDALIKVRIIRNLSQRELADRLSLGEHQVKRYEATRYRHASAERLQQVADALKLSVREVYTLEE